MKYSKTEKEVKSIRVHDSNCIGCKKTGKHMMLSYKMSKRKRPEIYLDKIKKLEEKRETNINKYIIPIEIKIQDEKDKIKKYYRKKGLL